MRKRVRTKHPISVVDITDLSKYSDEDLKYEMEKREKKRIAEEEAANRAYGAKQAEALTREVIDAFLPTHGRTSCSDDNLANGFYTAEEGSGWRCTRCALLELINRDYDFLRSGEVEVILELRPT